MPDPAPLADTDRLTRPCAAEGRARRRSPGRDDVGARFLAWPAAASATTLVSAACLLAGAWGLLGPSITDSEQISGRIGIVAALAAYLASLLAVVWVMCRWQAGNADALGASVVGAAFVIGQGAALDLISAERPLATGFIAVGGLGAAILSWRAWNRATGGATPRGLALPLLLVCAWSFVWPVVIGSNAFAAASANPDGAHAGSTIHAMTLWLPGWWLELIAVGLALVELVRGSAPWTGSELPFLSRPAMRWVQALIVFAAGGIHQFILGYTANLDFAWADFLPLAALLGLVVNELRVCARRTSTRSDAAAFAIPVALAALLVAIGGDARTFDDALNRGPSAARIPLAMTASPEAVPVMLALIGAAMWWRLRRAGLLAGAAISAVGAALMHGTAEGGFDFAAGLSATAVACGAWAIWRRHPRLVVAAAIALQAAVLISPSAQYFLELHGLSVPACLCGASGLIALVAAIASPTLLTRNLVRIAAWAAMVGVLHACLRDGSSLHAPMLGTICLAALQGWAAWRCRDRAVAAPLLVPAAFAVPYLMPANKAWLVIWAAFALLGGALRIGHQRIHRASIASVASAPVDPEAQLT